MSDQQNLVRMVITELEDCSARHIGTWCEDSYAKHYEFDLYVATNGKTLLLLRWYGLDDGELQHFEVFRPVTDGKSAKTLLRGIREHLT